VSYRFDFRKTLAAAAELLRLEPQRQMPYLRLLKLLYIADREALHEIGRPITGDRHVAMRYGPVPSRTYDIIKGEDTYSPEFFRHIEKQGYQLHLVDDPGNGSLNRFEIRKLRAIAERYREKDQWDTVELTHAFPEWQRNRPSGDSSGPIPVRDILAAGGLSSQRIDEILRDAEYAEKLAGPFGE
jgi:uncharacterized phage-associated protein